MNNIVDKLFIIFQIDVIFLLNIPLFWYIWAALNLERKILIDFE